MGMSTEQSGKYVTNLWWDLQGMRGPEVTTVIPKHVVLKKGA
jgi:hypothetical protein